MRHGHPHRGHTLGRGKDQHQGIFLPRLTGHVVAYAAPQVDDLLSAIVDRAGCAQFSALGKIAGKLLAYGLKPGRNRPMSGYW
jgi:hypothetical protein